MLYLAGPGCTWLDLAVPGLVWSGLVWFGLVWPCLVNTEGFKVVWNNQTYMSVDGMGYLQTGLFLDHLTVIIR